MKKFLCLLMFLGTLAFLGIVVPQLIGYNYFSNPTQYLLDIRYCGCTADEVFEKIKKYDPQTGIHLRTYGGGNCEQFDDMDKGRFISATAKYDTLYVNVNYFTRWSSGAFVAWALTFKNGVVVKQESILWTELPNFVSSKSIYAYSPITYTIDTTRLNIAPNSGSEPSYTKSIDGYVNKHTDNPEN